ncbi:MAG: ATP-binding protein [Ferruginibacter sp.]
MFQYQQKQNAYFKDIETLKTSYENTLLQSQLEIQELTFQNISREIHDNIGQKLTLAKLHLNTLCLHEPQYVMKQVAESVSMIGEAINDLSDISRSMSSEALLNNGFLNAVEFEAAKLKQSGLYDISLNASGNTIFLDANTELVLFRILQEAINNIVKHAVASRIRIQLDYYPQRLRMQIADNGKGFNPTLKNEGTGLGNIKKRTTVLNGTMNIQSAPGRGTTLAIEIPINDKDGKI